jgi:hypothetical protein
MKESIDEDCFRAYLTECVHVRARKINLKASLIENFPGQLRRFGLMIDMGEITSPPGSSMLHFSSMDDLATAFISHVSHAWPPIPEYMGVPLESLVITPLEHSMEWLMKGNLGAYSSVAPEIERFDQRLITAKLIKLFLSIDGSNIRYLDMNLIADKHIHAAIVKTPMAIKFIPQIRITKEMVTTAITGSANVLGHIDKKWQTDAMVKSCVSRQGLSLWHVANEFKTYENCKIAVQMHGKAIRFVPPEVADRALCNLALEREPLYACFSPPHLASFEESVASFVAYPSHIRRVKLDEYRFDVNSMLAEVASRSPDAVNFIPLPYMTNEVIMSALRSSPLHLGYLPKELVTKEVCEFAVSRDAMAITYVPLSMRNTVLLAVKNAKEAPSSVDVQP